MTLASYLLFCAAFATAAAVPGPGVAALVGRALKSGFSATLPTLLGIIIGDLIWFSFAALGLAMLAATLGGLFIVIKLAGAAYLLYLAYRFWTAPIEVEELGAIKKAGFFKGVLTGISVTLANPKAITFYLALMPAVLHLDEMSNQDFAIIAGTIAAILSLVLGSYIGFASRARAFFQAPNARRLLNRIAASVMGGAAILVASR
jgi:threonine/homoserine/homoserine lactone efflux protein